MKEKQDLITSIVLGKAILDKNMVMVNSVQFDRQLMGTTAFQINNKVKLHTCVTKLVPMAKMMIMHKTGLPTVKLEMGIIDVPEEFDDDSKTGVLLKRAENHYVILLDNSESYCTQRFTLCKELCEIIIECYFGEGGNPEKLEPYDKMAEAIRDLTDMFYGDDVSASLHAPFGSSESFANSLAIELMIPYNIRNELKPYIRDSDIEGVAQRLFLPTEVIEKYIKTHYDLTTPIYDALIAGV